MSAPTAARWRAGILEPLDACEVRPVRLLAVDSWLLRDGAVVALDAHRARFLGSVPADEAAAAADFWDAALAALPRTGTWFPCFELRAVEQAAREAPGRRELVLRVRPAPALRETLALATHDGLDPRRAPHLKGPDLDRLTAVRTAAQDRGADDAVLLDGTGAVAETATANLVWWRGETLVAPEPAIPQLPGVTRAALRALALAHGVEVRPGRATPGDLAGCELWALNSLHGIRRVERWVDGPPLTAAPGRLRAWRARLEALRLPLPLPETARA